jgi:hypothetical protein|eukprot:COSAG01_NODE_504_length_16140_cov_40.890967_19_plen_179_part_00
MLPLPSESPPVPRPPTLVRHLPKMPNTTEPKSRRRAGSQPLSPPIPPSKASREQGIDTLATTRTPAPAATIPAGGAIGKDDKRRRNRAAAVRFRKNKKLREEKLNTELAELRQCQEDWRKREEDWRKREEDWKLDKTQLQQSLEYYQKLFCKHNLQANIARAGTTVLSGLAMCIVRWV